MRRSDLFLQCMQRFKIRTQDLQIVPLRFRFAQQHVFERIAPLLDDRKRVWLIILKARREGISTLCQAMMLTRTMLQDHVHSMVMASKAGNTREIWQMAKTMVDHSPLAKIAVPKHKEIFIGKSKLTVATAGTPDATRGFDLTCLHCSEVAQWKDPETFLAALNCLPERVDTFCFVESTARGKAGRGKLFYQEWKRAIEGDSDFIPMFLPFFLEPTYSLPNYVFPDIWVHLSSDDKKAFLPLEPNERHRAEEKMLAEQFNLTAAQLAWRRWAIPNKCQDDENLFHQEYPATWQEAFVASGRPFFLPRQLAPFEEQVRKGTRYHIQDGKFVDDPRGPLELWVQPEAGHSYVIGADSSMGIVDEKDQHSHSAAQILDMETLEQVGEYDGVVSPHVFARHLAAMGRRYNTALIAPEVQASGGGGGREIIIWLKEHLYHNIHIWRHPDKIRADRGILFGWETNSRTRPRMIGRMREHIQERSCTIHSAKLLGQLADFGETSEDRYEAMTEHDDLLMAWGIALMSRSENYYPKIDTAPVVSQDWTPDNLHVREEPQSRLTRMIKMIERGIKEKRQPQSYLEM